MSDRPGTPARTSDTIDIVVPAENAEDLYERAPCGYLSTLPDGTIIKINGTLLSWTGYRREDIVGRRRFVDLLSAGGRIYHETHYAPLLSMQDHVREIALDLVCADGRRLPVLVNSILVRSDDGQPHVIRTSVFDATDRREYERELLRARERAERSEARARVLARTLQTSLMPPSPPEIEGVELAASYRAAGTGDEVGGDFYDVFEAGEGDWSVLVGDVCGKGAEAAVVTALVRYTARAAAIRVREPSAVLSAVNAALLRHTTDRFCTVVYLRVRPRGGDAVEVTVASAGHPLPIRMSRGGLTTAGEPGTLLGVVDDPRIDDATLVLRPGDALFCYTDGLTEGRRDDEFFGDARLHDVLQRLVGQPGSSVTKTVVDEAVAFQRGNPRDDMATVYVGCPSAAS